MPNGYSWKALRKTGGRDHLPGPDRLGWWAALALILSLALHVLVFVMLEQMGVGLCFEQAREMQTTGMVVTQVQSLPTNDEAAPPIEEKQDLLDDTDLLQALPPNSEIDLKTEVKQAEYDLKMNQPILAGDPNASAVAAAKGFEIEGDTAEVGRGPSIMKPAEVGQMTVDPGLPDSVDTMGKAMDDWLKRGAGGNATEGAMDGVSSLDDMLALPPNLLLSAKTLLPSDLLFEYNKADLRDGAKVGLMKVALLMDRNPDMFCWIEGHSDLIGGDEFNMELSRRRAESVRTYLVEGLKMDGTKIVTRGFGKMKPMIAQGNVEQQGPNRRVEILMRKTLPDPVVIPSPAPAPTPSVNPPAPQPPVEATPPPILVKPKRKWFGSSKPLTGIAVEDEVLQSVPVEEEGEPLPAVPAER